MVLRGLWENRDKDAAAERDRISVGGDTCFWAVPSSESSPLLASGWQLQPRSVPVPGDRCLWGSGTGTKWPLLQRWLLGSRELRGCTAPHLCALGGGLPEGTERAAHPSASPAVPHGSAWAAAPVPSRVPRAWAPGRCGGVPEGFGAPGATCRAAAAVQVQFSPGSPRLPAGAATLDHLRALTPLGFMSGVIQMMHDGASGK